MEFKGKVLIAAHAGKRCTACDRASAELTSPKDISLHVHLSEFDFQLILDIAQSKFSPWVPAPQDFALCVNR